MVTEAFQMLLDGNVRGAIAYAWTSSPVGEWVYLIGSLAIIFGTWLKYPDDIEVPTVLGIIFASPVIALTITTGVGLQAARVGLILLAFSLAGMFYWFAIGRQQK